MTPPESPQPSRLKRLIEQAEAQAREDLSSASQQQGPSMDEDAPQAEVPERGQSSLPASEAGAVHASAPEQGSAGSEESSVEQEVGDELERRLSVYEDLRAAEIEKAQREAEEREERALQEEEEESSWEDQRPIDRITDKDVGPSAFKRWGRHTLVAATVATVMAATMAVRSFNKSIELHCPVDRDQATRPAQGQRAAFGPVEDVIASSAGQALSIYRSDRSQDFKKGAQLAHRMLVDQARTLIQDPQARAAIMSGSLAWAQALPSQDEFRYYADMVEHPGADSDSRITARLSQFFAQIHASSQQEDQAEFTEKRRKAVRSMRYLAQTHDAHAETQCHVLPTGGYTPQLHERLQKTLQQVEANQPRLSEDFALGFQQTLAQAREALSQQAPTQQPDRVATR